jgi:hypothetical protein
MHMLGPESQREYARRNALQHRHGVEQLEDERRLRPAGTL